MLLTFHVFLCVVLVLVILLQAGKSGGSISPLGGTSQSLFGATGAGNFLTKSTTVVAVLFFLTSLVLTLNTSREASQSIIRQSQTSPQETKPHSGTPESPVPTSPNAPKTDTGITSGDSPSVPAKEP
jgi:preprotein translocase subunit SecG